MVSHCKRICLEMESLSFISTGIYDSPCLLLYSTKHLHTIHKRFENEILYSCVCMCVCVKYTFIIALFVSRKFHSSLNVLGHTTIRILFSCCCCSSSSTFYYDPYFFYCNHVTLGLCEFTYVWALSLIFLLMIM